MSTNNARQWNIRFKDYTEFIAQHRNYKGLFIARGDNGDLNWVVAGKSLNGKQRKIWWDKKCREKKINIEPGCYARIAALIHPTKIHICQICGEGLSVKYVYPNKRLLNLLNKNFNKEYLPYKSDIFTVIKDLSFDNKNLIKIGEIFKFVGKNITKENLLKFIEKNHVENKNKAFLSPGVMSNSPDRFDGFHSDGNCCRGLSDKGRHKDNLSRYSQDRRAYTNWSDGDWKKADRLMSLYGKYNLSADHIGPISLGFCHRPKFQAMTKEENSTKNNRMSFSDVKLLISDEESGETVISWHSKFIWDILKNLVQNDEDALKLSKIMRINMHHVLIIFSIVYNAGFKDFLKQFLNPEYSFFDYKFNDFNPKTGNFSSVVKIVKTGKNQQNNVDRYERISFDELKKYSNVNNRRVNKWKNTNVDALLQDMIVMLSKNEQSKAKIMLNKCFNLLAKDALKEWFK